MQNLVLFVICFLCARVVAADVKVVSNAELIEAENLIAEQEPVNLNVFYPDDREEAPDEYPYTSVGKIFFAKGNKYYHCTANLISPEHILTNAHCLFSKNNT